MAYQALATGPISFLDTNYNQQEIPLSAIYFDSNGPNANSWPNYLADSALIQALLQQLAAQGLLKPGTKTTPTPALTIAATEVGATGNAIQVTISNVSASAGTMTMLVSATEVYPGLTTANIAAALGTSAPTANGLVYLQSNNDQAPAAFSGTPKPDLTWAIPQAANSSDTAFTLAAVDSADATNIDINVSPDPSPATTFTLTAAWKKSQGNVTLAMLTTASTNPFSMLVNFTGPANGPLPAPGTVTLQGGAGATSTPAVAANANVFSS